MKSRISIVRCSDYEPALVYERVKHAIGLLGGITAFVKPGSKVLIKPNLLMARGPEFAICTHPEIVRAVIKILKEINCRIIVGDGPSVWGKYVENVEEVYEKSGIKAVAAQEAVELIKFENRQWHGQFPLARAAFECDHVINLPKFKTHELTLLTGAVKNLFGLVWGTYKTELHKKYFDIEEFAKILIDIYQQIKPSLTIVDGILAMEGDGPASSGLPKKCGLVLAGSDCVAIDSVLAVIIGVDPLDVFTIREAAKRGDVGTDLKNIDILGEKLEDAKGAPFILPSASMVRKVPPAIANLARKLIKYYPCVERDNCIKCAACIDSCPKKVIKMTPKGITFNYSGCIACFCCQEACPASAIKVKKSFLAKLIGL
ncbi:MAG: DUF362 domain-containing protein [Candidatus Omnitrophota bacterium]